MDPNRLRSRTRVTTFKFQDALGLKNRLHSRTRVTTFKFQSALNLKNRLRSRTRVAIFKFQSALDLKNRLRSRTRVATLMINRVLKTLKTKPNRDPVLRDQKVLPEVRNRPLLPREYFSHSTFRNSVLIQ